MRSYLVEPDQGADFWVFWTKHGKRGQHALNVDARLLRETGHVIARLTGLGCIGGRGEPPHLAPDDLEDRDDTDADGERHRYWSDGDKLRIMEESLIGHRRWQPQRGDTTFAGRCCHLAAAVGQLGREI